MSQENPPELPSESGNQYPRSQVQPVWKVAIIQALRGTIGILETTVEKLETTPASDTEATPGFLQHLASRWNRFLLKTRAFIPSNLSTKLSDIALTGIIASIAIVLVWTTTSVFNNKPTEIATAPPVEEVPTPTATITTPPEPTVTEPPKEQIIPKPEAQVPPPTETKPEPIPTPTPTRQLTPEEALIVAIENQIAEISDRLQPPSSNGITSAMIKSIQANFRSSSLTVKITNDWYKLQVAQQEKLAADILKRSQELDFAHLEIIDSQDRLVARNPVVGNKMIILQRQATTGNESNNYRNNRV